MAGWLQEPDNNFRLWKSQIWSHVSVAIRLPPLFVMDSLLAMWSSESPEKQGMLESVLNSLVMFLLYSPALVLAFIAFILETRQLLKVYLFLSSVGVLVWSYIWNKELVKTAAELADQQTNLLYECLTFNTNVLIKAQGNYILQVFFGIIFSFSAQLTSATRLFYLWLIFIGPTFFTLFSPIVAHGILSWTPIVSAVAAHLVLIYGLLSNIQTGTAYLKEILQWAKIVVANEGFFVLLKSQWRRLQVPLVLRLFCVSRMIGHAFIMIADTHAAGEPLSWLALSKYLLVRGCDTTLSVMGVTSLFGMVIHYITMAVQAFLQVNDSEEQMGTVSSMLFFILAMQSGLPSMNPDRRLYRLFQNVCLIITAMLHYSQSMINSLLQLLGASLNSPREKHVRALLGCVFIVISSIGLMYVTWSRHNVSTWILALSCFSMEVMAKVIVSLIIYVLFMIDARLNSSWEPFDDYVYTMRAFSSCLELVFATFLALNGVWIFFFEESGTIRAFMIAFHGYFNVWAQARQSWTNSVRRREASRRLAEFRRATPEELNRLNDVCAICHHEMELAIVTDCEHFYHVNCLRRWLFMQNHCPICHSEFDSQKNRAQQANFLQDHEGGLLTPLQPENLRRQY